MLWRAQCCWRLLACTRLELQECYGLGRGAHPAAATTALLLLLLLLRETLLCCMIALEPTAVKADAEQARAAQMARRRRAIVKLMS